MRPLVSLQGKVASASGRPMGPALPSRIARARVSASLIVASLARLPISSKCTIPGNAALNTSPTPATRAPVAARQKEKTRHEGRVGQS